MNFLQDLENKYQEIILENKTAKQRWEEERNRLLEKHAKILSELGFEDVKIGRTGVNEVIGRYKGDFVILRYEIFENENSSHIPRVLGPKHPSFEYDWQRQIIKNRIPEKYHTNSDPWYRPEDEMLGGIEEILAPHIINYLERERNRNK